MAALQVELFESELEELQGGKKGKKPPARLTEVEELTAKFKEHVGMLEKVWGCGRG